MKEFLYFSPQGEKVAKEQSKNGKIIYTHLKRINTFHRITMQCLRHCRANLPCGDKVRLASPRPQAQSWRLALYCPFGVFRRGLCELVSTNTCREPMEYVFGSHKRSSRRLAISFRSFLVRTRKGHVSPLRKGERKRPFLSEEKRTKRLIEAIASNSHYAAGKRIHTAQRCCSARGARTGHKDKLESNLYPFKA